MNIDSITMVKDGFSKLKNKITTLFTKTDSDDQTKFLTIVTSQVRIIAGCDVGSKNSITIKHGKNDITIVCKRLSDSAIDVTIRATNRNVLVSDSKITLSSLGSKLTENDITLENITHQFKDINIEKITSSKNYDLDSVLHKHEREIDDFVERCRGNTPQILNLTFPAIGMECFTVDIELIYNPVAYWFIINTYYSKMPLSIKAEYCSDLLKGPELFLSERIGEILEKVQDHVRESDNSLYFYYK